MTIYSTKASYPFPLLGIACTERKYQNNCKGTRVFKLIKSKVFMTTSCFRFKVWRHMVKKYTEQKTPKTIPLSIKGRKHHTEFELITKKVVDKSETHSRARQDFLTFLKDYVFCLQNKKKLRAKQVISIWFNSYLYCEHIFLYKLSVVKICFSSNFIIYICFFLQFHSYTQTFCTRLLFTYLIRFSTKI